MRGDCREGDSRGQVKGAILRRFKTIIRREGLMTQEIEQKSQLLLNEILPTPSDVIKVDRYANSHEDDGSCCNAFISRDVSQ